MVIIQKLPIGLLIKTTTPPRTTTIIIITEGICQALAKAFCVTLVSPLLSAVSPFAEEVWGSERCGTFPGITQLVEKQRGQFKLPWGPSPTKWDTACRLG